MLISQNRKGQNRLDYPFFTRAEVYDSNITTTQSYSYKYNLTGIARNNTCGLEIYETYFLSKYTLEYLKERGRRDFKLDFKHLSMFFKHCIRLLSIRSIVQPQTTTTKINGFINDFFGHSHLNKHQSRSQSRGVDLKNNLNREEEIKNLKDCIKPFVNNIFQKQLNVLIKQKDKTESDLLLLIYQITEEWLNKIKIDLEDQKQMQNQVLPECFTKLSKKRTKDYIMVNLKKIIKIQALKTTAKKDTLQLFLDINRNFMMVKIPFIMQSSMRPKEKQTANQIILPRYTDEKQIIACKLISKSKKNQCAIKLQQKELRNQFELIKDLVLYLIKYNKSTHYFYPNITAQDVYFDERKLKIFVTHHPLILDGIGIKKSSKPLQLQIACEPTPQFDFQQCHLEWQNKCKLKQKYYFPSLYKRKVDDSDEDFQEQVNNNQIGRLEQQIHVWRIINIVYYISNNRKMTNSLFSYYRPNQPFQFKSYKEAVKQIYQDLSKNADFLIKLLPPVQFQLKCSKLKQNGQEFSQNEWKKKVENIMKSLSNKIRQHEMEIIKNRKDNEQKFHFSLQDLRQKFNIPDDEEDSLLQELKLKSIKAEFYLRTIIVKQINFLLLDKKSFKKLSNAKKYLLLYFIYMFQDLYFMQVCRKNRRFMTNFKQQLKAELQKGYNGLNLSQQSEKRKNNRINCFEKLIQYNQRDYDDNNRNFLKKNPEFMEDMNKVDQTMHLIKKIELIQSQYFFMKKPTLQQIETVIQEKSAFLSNQDIQKLSQIKYEIKLVKCLQDLQTTLSQPISSLSENQKERIIRQLIEEIFSNIICNTDIRKDTFLEQFFTILLQKQQKDKIALVITQLNQQYKIDRIREDLIMIFVRSLNKSKGQLQSKMIHIKKMMSIDEQNLPKLVKIVDYLIYKIKRSRSFEEFKENWSKKIQQKMRYSHKIIITNLDKLFCSHIQPYLKNPENFHKLSDFNGKVEVCLFYNQKLLTLMKFFLSINRRNWKDFERVYNLMQIEDKTVNFRSQVKAIDMRDVNDIKIDIRKLELLRDTPIQEIQEVILDSFKKKEENNQAKPTDIDLLLKKTNC